MRALPEKDAGRTPSSACRVLEFLVKCELAKWELEASGGRPLDEELLPRRGEDERDSLVGMRSAETARSKAEFIVDARELSRLEDPCMALGISI
jgi:hypothetical protein